jgi:hypothetical protein
MSNLQLIGLCAVGSAVLLGIGEFVFYLLKSEMDNEQIDN